MIDGYFVNIEKKIKLRNTVFRIAIIDAEKDVV